MPPAASCWPGSRELGVSRGGGVQPGSGGRSPPAKAGSSPEWQVASRVDSRSATAVICIRLDTNPARAGRGIRAVFPRIGDIARPDLARGRTKIGLTLNIGISLALLDTSSRGPRGAPGGPRLAAIVPIRRPFARREPLRARCGALRMSSICMICSRLPEPPSPSMFSKFSTGTTWPNRGGPGLGAGFTGSRGVSYFRPNPAPLSSSIVAADGPGAIRGERPNGRRDDGLRMARTTPTVAREDKSSSAGPRWRLPSGPRRMAAAEEAAKLRASVAIFDACEAAASRGWFDLADAPTDPAERARSFAMLCTRLRQVGRASEAERVLSEGREALLKSTSLVNPETPASGRTSGPTSSRN